MEIVDVIIKINDAKIKDKGTMMEQMSRFRPGDKIKVTYVRDNKTQTTTITLKNSQGNTSITKSNDILDLGCAFKELSDKQKKDLGISKGVEVLASSRNTASATDLSSSTSITIRYRREKMLKRYTKQS